MAFQKVAENEPVYRGSNYRSTYYFKLPWNAFIRGTMIAAIQSSAPVLKLKGIELKSVEAISPELTEQTAGGRYMRWRLVVTWRAL